MQRQQILICRLRLELSAKMLSLGLANMLYTLFHVSGSFRFITVIQAILTLSLIWEGSINSY